MELVEKLESLSRKKALMEEQEKNLEERKNQILSELVQKYGENWQDQYDTALREVDTWEKEHAAS